MHREIDTDSGADNDVFMAKKLESVDRYKRVLGVIAK
jgi:hypothetical protein